MDWSCIRVSAIEEFRVLRPCRLSSSREPENEKSQAGKEEKEAEMILRVSVQLSYTSVGQLCSLFLRLSCALLDAEG
jgi:hypothetical protein